MRSILQVVGGVAVAGAVAAGSTAFTAAGFTFGSGLSAPVVVGGSLSPTIVGATLEGLNLTYNSGTSQVTGMSVRMLGDGGTLPAGSRVTVVSAGTKSAPNEFYCLPSVGDGGAYQKSTCVFGTDANNAAGHITGMSALTISVQGPTN